MNLTPKEKAQELVELYKPLVTTWDCYWDTARNEEDIISDAKQCALIAVNEVIFSLPLMPYGMQYLCKRDYWEDIKQEIEKL
jgi:hypothetical protein